VLRRSQGVLGAFVHRDWVALGKPYSLTSSFDVSRGGFAFTLAADATHAQATSLLGALRNYSWLDRQTVEMSIELSFYTPMMDYLSHTQLVMRASRSGTADVSLMCVSSVDEEFFERPERLVYLGLFMVLLLGRALRLFWAWQTVPSLNQREALRAKLASRVHLDDAGGLIRSRVTVTPLLVANLLLVVIGLTAAAYRIVEMSMLEIRQFREVHEAAHALPPFIPWLPGTLMNMRYSKQIFGYALLVCLVQ
jgi:hypothetical protein